ncbi:PQQ-binding-like beta-propeller repeat protein [Actinoplanes sp. DH11]|uniref:outer membrane protein assembly factor BamB family protein n=1 Tax=Actinoplanes sp. DH11 TaxID=2857011 RepID=UPI001E3388CD|nr:PQQ-binding-like beta-propeller repeat protein [Actinoplanes sp. DH11]
MAVIELGEMTGRPPDPLGDRIGAGLDRRRLRPAALVAAALAVLAVLAGGAAVPPPAPAVRLLWTASYSVEQSVVVADDAVFVVSGGTRAEVVAYSITSGERLWRWGTDAHLITVHPAPGGGPVLVTLDPASAGSPDGPAAQASRTTVALRARSGAELWRRPGQPHWQAVERDTALITEFDIRGGVGALARVRLEDGVPLWRTPGTPAQQVGVDVRDGRPGRVVTITAAGDVTVLDPAGGTRLAARRLPAPNAEMSVSGGRLLMARYGAGGPVTDVYRLDTLDLVHSGPVTDCGDVLCSAGPAGFAALDPGTGRALWHGPEIISSVMTGDRILTDEREGSEHTLLDSRTGRRLASGLRGWVAWADHWRDEVLLLRPSAEPIGRTTVTRVDLRTGRTRLLGSLAPLPDQQGCRAVPGHLVCTGWDRVLVAAVP